MDLDLLIDLLKKNAELAVNFDAKGNRQAAIYYYLTTVSQITQAQNLNRDDKVDLSSFIAASNRYSERAEALKTEAHQAAFDSAKKSHESSAEFQRAKFCLVEALQLDEAGQEDEAVDLYAEAVELCLKAKNETQNDKLKEKLAKLAKQALGRAEQIKRPSASSRPEVPANQPTLTSPPLGGASKPKV